MNPWPALRRGAPFVLDKDAAAVATFNARATPRTQLRTDLLPEPFVGRLDAPVVLLALNPGLSRGDFRLHRDPAFRRRVRACHRQEPVEWPYYYLDPRVNGPGARWNRRILRPLIREVGEEAVARGVVLIEYLPYHSRRFGYRRVVLPSQAFTRAVVQRALKRGAVIFVTRGLVLWAEALPELKGHPRVFQTHSRQNVVISPRNCPEGFDAALKALRKR